jgi:hypothetical protein
VALFPVGSPMGGGAGGASFLLVAMPGLPFRRFRTGAREVLLVPVSVGASGAHAGPAA